MGVTNEAGAATWTELVTGDTKAAEAFYTGLFGWQAKLQPMETMVYTVFRRGETQAAGMMPKPKEMGEAPPSWLTYFGVEDCEKTVQRASGLGARVLAPTMTLPRVGSFAVLMDPQGAVFGLLQPGRS